MLLTRHLDANATLVSLIERLTPCDGFSPTHLPGVQVLRASCDVARGPQIYEPSLMFVAQGSKVAYLGPRTLEYGTGHLPDPGDAGAVRMRDVRPGARRTAAGGDGGD